MSVFDNQPALLEVQRRYRESEAVYSEWQEAKRREFEGSLEGWEERRRRCREAEARLHAAQEAFDAALAHWRPIKKKLEWAAVNGVLQFWKRRRA